jgi:tRNA 2-thiouridine synthesizing protein A
MADATLDATGLKCPLPVLRARKALGGLAPGALLEVRATDPGAVRDFAAYCAASGHVMVESAEVDGVFRFVIRRGS